MEKKQQPVTSYCPDCEKAESRCKCKQHDVPPTDNGGISESVESKGIEPTEKDSLLTKKLDKQPKISNKHIVTNGKAAFYACILPNLKEAAYRCGWALGIHGSLSSDMDIMAMAWTEDARPVEEMIQALSDCFTDNCFKDKHIISHHTKPNNRVVYTMNIWADFYLDINVIQPNVSQVTDIERAIELAIEETINNIDTEDGIYIGSRASVSELKQQILDKLTK